MTIFRPLRGLTGMPTHRCAMPCGGTTDPVGELVVITVDRGFFPSWRGHSLLEWFHLNTVKRLAKAAGRWVVVELQQFCFGRPAERAHPN